MTDAGSTYCGLSDALAAAEERIDILRAEVGLRTRERDEWEANEQEQAREVTRLEATVARLAVEELNRKMAAGAAEIAGPVRGDHRSTLPTVMGNVESCHHCGGTGYAGAHDVHRGQVGP